MQKLPGDYHIMVQMISLSANACLIWNMNVLVSMTGCDPDLFEYVLKLRKRRIDLEELLAEKKRSSDALKRKCDFLTEKVVACGFLSYYINRHVSFTHYPFSLSDVHMHVLFVMFGPPPGKTVKEQSQSSRR